MATRRRPVRSQTRYAPTLGATADYFTIELELLLERYNHLDTASRIGILLASMLHMTQAAGIPLSKIIDIIKRQEKVN